MNTGSRVLVADGVFTGVEGILKSIKPFGQIGDNFALVNELYADIKVDNVNIIKVPLKYIQEVEIIDEGE